jgi:hypothetical protein
MRASDATDETSDSMPDQFASAFFSRAISNAASA